MKLLKRTILWLVLMAVIVFVVDLAGTLIVNKVCVKMMEDATVGYSMKVERMLHPVPKEPDEKNKTNGLSGFTFLSLLDNARIRNNDKWWSIFLFLNLDVDQSTVFFDEDGMTELSSGIFAVVYEDQGGKSDYIKYAVGVIDINEFIKNECSSDIYDILEKNGDVSLRLDSYSIDSSFLVHPASITLLDGSGTELGKYDIPCSGDIVKGENILIQHDQSDKINSDLSFYKKIKDARLGRRKADRIAEKLVDKADFSQSRQRYTKRSYGLGVITSKHVETTDGNAMVFVQRFYFYKGVILYTLLFGGIMTLIFVLVCRSKDKKKESAGSYQNYYQGGSYGGYTNNYSNNYGRPNNYGQPTNYGAPNNYPSNYNNPNNRYR